MNMIGGTMVNKFPIARTENYFKYYHPLLRKFDSEYLVVSADSDAVSTEYHVPIHKVPFKSVDDGRFTLDPLALNIITFEDPMVLKVNIWTYPAFWRSLWSLLKLAKKIGAVRLIELGTDCWVHTQRFADRLSTYQGPGIGCPWCARYQMLDLALASFHRDVFDSLIAFIESKTWAEWTVPQTMDFENCHLRKVQCGHLVGFDWGSLYAIS